MALFPVTQRTVFYVVSFVIVMHALYTANPDYFLEQLASAGKLILFGIAPLARFACVLYVVSFTLLLILHFLPTRIPARYAYASVRKVCNWLAATYSSLRRRWRLLAGRHVHFAKGLITEVVCIASHRSYTFEERLGMFSSGEMLSAMRRRNTIEHVWELNWGRVVEEEEFFIDIYGKRWHPAHVDWTLYTLPRQDHPQSLCADEEVAVVALDVSTDDSDGRDSDSSSNFLATSMSHDEPRANIELIGECCSYNQDSSFVGSFASSAGNCETDVPLRTDDDSSSSCSTSMAHDEPLVNSELIEGSPSDDDDSFLMGSCGASAGNGGVDVPPRTDSDSNNNSNCSISTTHGEPLENIEFNEDCFSYNEDFSSANSCGSFADGIVSDILLETDDDSNSKFSASHGEPVVDFELIDVSSSEDDDSPLGSCGSSAGDDNADLYVHTEPEPSSSTVRCAQPSQRCRTRPFLARLAKQGEPSSSTVRCAQPSQRCRTRRFLARLAKQGLKRYT